MRRAMRRLLSRAGVSVQRVKAEGRMTEVVVHWRRRWVAPGRATEPVLVVMSVANLEEYVSAVESVRTQAASAASMPEHYRSDAMGVPLGSALDDLGFSPQV